MRTMFKALVQIVGFFKKKKINILREILFKNNFIFKNIFKKKMFILALIIILKEMLKIGIRLGILMVYYICILYNLMYKYTF